MLVKDGIIIPGEVLSDRFVLIVTKLDTLLLHVPKDTVYFELTMSTQLRLLYSEGKSSRGLSLGSILPRMLVSLPDSE